MEEKDSKSQKEATKKPCSTCFLSNLKWLLIPLLLILLSYSIQNYSKYSAIPREQPKSSNSDLKSEKVLKNKEPKEKSPTIKSSKNITDKEMVDFMNSLFLMELEDFRTVEKESFKLKEIIKFNNLHFFPRITSLVQLDPFKFVKFNLKRPCTLFPDIFSCTKM